MKRLLLIIAFVLLWAIGAHAQTIPPMTVVTVCPIGGRYPTIHDATRAIAGDYSQLYDVQICKGTYNEAPGKLDFNGVIEGMGASQDDVLVQLPTAAGAASQYYFAVGTQITPYPGSNLIFRNFHVDGTVPCKNGTLACKAPRAVQIQSADNVRFENMHFTDNQDDILGNPWTPADGIGTVTVVNSNLEKGCSPNGPSHHIYVNFGVLDVENNTFGPCAYGYPVKSRSFRTIVNHDIFTLNMANTGVPASGAVDISEGGTATITYNTLAFGPLTGTDGQPAQAFLLGGTLGRNLPASYVLDHNIVALPGVTHAFTVVSNLDQNQAVSITNTVLPAKSALRAVLQGQGTIGPGNTYADGSAVTEVTQNTEFFSYGLFADYRSTSTPLTVAAPFANKTIWAGDAMLTVTSSGGAVIGGPGGVNIGPGAVQFVWTDPASQSNVLHDLTYFQEISTYGQNDTVSVAGPCKVAPVNVFAGTTTFSHSVIPTPAPFCQLRVYNGATLVDHTAAGEADTLWVYKGGTALIDGPGAYYAGALAESDAIIQATGLGSPAYTFTIQGGWVGGGYRTGSYNFTGYDAGPDNLPTFTLGATTSEPYVLSLRGGGVVYAGVNKVSIAGNTRSKGPTISQITYHVQSSVVGSAVNGQFGPVKVVLDGSGVVKASRANNSAQPITIDVAGGSGSVEVAQSWRPTVDACHLNGAAIASQGAVGANYVIHLSTGGTLQFDATKTAPSCS